MTDNDFKYILVNLTAREYDLRAPRNDCNFKVAIRDNYWTESDYIIGVPNIPNIPFKRLNAPKIILGYSYPQYSLTLREAGIIKTINPEPA